MTKQRRRSSPYGSIGISQEAFSWSSAERASRGGFGQTGAAKRIFTHLVAVREVNPTIETASELKQSSEAAACDVSLQWAAHTQALSFKRR